MALGPGEDVVDVGFGAAVASTGRELAPDRHGRRRVQVVLADGERACWVVPTDAAGRARTERERGVYERFPGGFHPTLLGVDPATGGLLLEDTGHTHAPPPYHPDHVRAVLRALAAVRGRRDLRGLDPPPIEPWNEGWRHVASLDLFATGASGVDPSWVRAHVEPLTAAADRTDLRGPHLVHGGLAGNVTTSGRRACLTDWGGAGVGNPELDTATLWFDVVLADGPADLVEVGDPGAWAARFTGWMVAARLGAPGQMRCPDRWLDDLPWALRVTADLLGLQPPPQ